MPDPISIHDNHLLSYSVSALEKQIVLHTVFPHLEPHEFTDVIFEGVLAYDFQRDLFGTIIFDIEEVEMAKFLQDRMELFEEGWRYGWPRGWEPQKEDIAKYIQRLNMKAYELTPSYGMTGWVLASSMRKFRVSDSNSEKIEKAIQIGRRGLWRFYDEGMSRWSRAALSPIFSNLDLEIPQIQDELQRLERQGFIRLFKTESLYIEVIRAEVEPPFT